MWIVVKNPACIQHEGRVFSAKLIRYFQKTEIWIIYFSKSSRFYFGMWKIPALLIYCYVTSLLHLFSFQHSFHVGRHLVQLYKYSLRSTVPLMYHLLFLWKGQSVRAYCEMNAWIWTYNLSSYCICFISEIWTLLCTYISFMLNCRAYRAFYILNWIYRYITEPHFSRWIGKIYHESKRKENCCVTNAALECLFFCLLAWFYHIKIRDPRLEKCSICIMYI